MTVRDLIEKLEDHDPDTEIVFRFDESTSGRCDPLPVDFTDADVDASTHTIVIAPF